MYDRGYGRTIVLELLRIIDWMIRLPAGLEEAFWQETHLLEESTKMAYVTSIERIGIRKGLEQGRQEGLREGEAAVLLRLIERRFGKEAADASSPRLAQADADTLLSWSERILIARRVEEVFGDD